jgi:hypothetical protein
MTGRRDDKQKEDALLLLTKEPENLFVRQEQSVIPHGIEERPQQHHR